MHTLTQALNIYVYCETINKNTRQQTFLSTSSDSTTLLDGVIIRLTSIDTFVCHFRDIPSNSHHIIIRFRIIRHHQNLTRHPLST